MTDQRKAVIILSCEEEGGHKLNVQLQELNLYDVSYFSYRADAIESISGKDYDSVVFFDPAGTRDIDVILRYITTIKDNVCPKFFIVSGRIEIFKEILERYINFDIRMLNLPMNVEGLVKTLSRSLSPEIFKDTGVQYKVDTRFLRVFIDATYYVLQELFADELEMEHESPYFLEKEMTEVAIRSKLQIESDYFTGHIYLSMPQDTYLKIYHRVVGEDHKHINDENTDLINEMANMIYGHSKKKFGELNYRFKMAIPTLFLDDIYDSDKTIIVIPFKSKVGSFFIKVALQ